MSYLTMENVLTVLTVASGVIAGASVIAAVIAPHTKTDLDDRAVGWLGKVKSVLDKLALNFKS